MRYKAPWRYRPQHRCSFGDVCPELAQVLDLAIALLSASTEVRHSRSRSTLGQLVTKLRLARRVSTAKRL